MKKRKTKKNYIFPHASSSAFLHIAVLVFGTVAIVILERDLGEQFSYVILICASVFPVILVLMAVLLNVFFWNAVVVIDDEGMHQRRGLHVYSWRWKEIQTVKCKTQRPRPFRSAQWSARFSPKFRFRSLTHGKELAIVMEYGVRKRFFQRCPDEMLKRKCQDLLRECNFFYI